MIVVTVARKPLSAGTVAANVLEHGCGALNIDASRISTMGEEIHAPQSDPAKRSGEVGTDLGITGAAIDKFQDAQRASIERTNTMGRWPANLILGHLEGCRCVGAKQVQADRHYPAKELTSPGGNGHTMGAGWSGRDGTDRRTHEEEVPAWECQPDCPVAALDERSGDLSSQKTRSEPDKPHGTGSIFGDWKGKKAQGPEYHNETGGASRFFKQVGGTRK